MNAVSPRQSRAKWTWPRVVVCIAIVGAAITGLWLVTWHATFTRKLLMHVIQPTAVFWLGILFCCWVSATRGRRLIAPLLLVIGIGYAICGNEHFANFALGTLERDYYHIDPFTVEPLDALIVLGGGVSTRRDGVAQLNSSGDRVMLAARLYHVGKARRLIARGSSIPEINITSSGADATARIWRDLGISD